MDPLVKPLHDAFVRTLSLEGALRGSAIGTLGAAVAVLLMREFTPALPATVALALIPLSAAAGAVVRLLRHLPDDAACTAMADDAAHAGGLLLVSDLPGASNWTPPQKVPCRVPCAIRRPLVACVGAGLALAFALFAPEAWFARAQPPPPALSFPDVTTALKNDLDALHDEGTLDEAEIETFRETVKHIEEIADPSNPAATLEAVDQVAEQLRTRVELKAETARRLLRDNQPLSVAQNAEDLTRELQQMLAEAPPSDDSTAGDGSGTGDGDGDGDGDGEDTGDGEQVGSGGVNRGRGDAPLNWTDPSQRNGLPFADRTFTGKPVNDRLLKTGESIADKDPSQPATTGQAAPRTALGGRAGGLSQRSRVSPRHRATVKRYFTPTEKSHP